MFCCVHRAAMVVPPGVLVSRSSEIALGMVRTLGWLAVPCTSDTGLRCLQFPVWSLAANGIAVSRYSGLHPDGVSGVFFGAASRGRGKRYPPSRRDGGYLLTRGRSWFLDLENRNKHRKQRSGAHLVRPRPAWQGHGIILAAICQAKIPPPFGGGT